MRTGVRTAAPGSAQPRVSVRWVAAPAPRFASLVEAVLPLVRREAEGNPVTPPDGSIWKVRRRRDKRTVFRHEDAEQHVYCKYYTARSSWRLSRIMHAFKSPAARSAGWFREMERIGVGTATVVAVGELPDLRRSFAPPPSILVTRSTPDQRTLHELLRDGRIPVGDRAEVCGRLREAVRKIHDAGMGSLELSTKNVLLDTSDGRILLFDLDRLGWLPLPYKRRRVVRRDLATVDTTCGYVMDGRDPLPPDDAPSAVVCGARDGAHDTAHQHGRREVTAS